MKKVLILSAGSVKHKLYFSNFIHNSTALLPINVRNISSYIIEFYQQYETGIEIYIAINMSDIEEVSDELSYYSNVHLIGVRNTKNVIDTLASALNQIPLNENIIINIGTSIPTLFPENRSIVLDQDKRNNYGWSGVTFNEDTVTFHSKNMNNLACHSFTGIFSADTDHLKSAILMSGSSNDLVDVAKALFLTNNYKFNFSEWIDCGHEINYYESKSRLISSRSFNAIKIESIAGVITKSSENIKKFTDEIRYIELLPKDVTVFFPSLYSDVTLKDKIAFASMEYYGYPTLAEYSLYWNIPDYIWAKIFDALKYVLENFKAHHYSIGKNAYSKFYIDKTFSRIMDFKEQLNNQLLFSKLFSDCINIDNQTYFGFDLLSERIRQKIKALYNEDDFCIMHGDLCFNNILYDIPSGIIRLIDARGSFGEGCIGIYGDIKYDLAKLTHSAIGAYDSIVNNLFTLKESNNGFKLKIKKRQNAMYLEALIRQLNEHFGYNHKDILFLTGLLFISMCPLHNDNLNRQIAFYLNGIKLINENIG